MSHQFKKDQDKKYVYKQVTIEGKDWTAALAEAEKKLYKNLKVKGYRSGKVPKNVADKYITRAQVLHEAMSVAINNYFTKDVETKLQAELQAFESAAVYAPRIEKVNPTEEKFEFELSFPIEVKVEDLILDKVDAQVNFAPVTDEEVEKVINAKLQRLALTVPLAKDQTTKLGDTVVIDYFGTLKETGEAFEGGEAKDVPVTLGNKSFIEGFEEALLDKKVGWEGDFDVTFPEKYPSATVAGKKANFKVTLKEAKRPEEIKLTAENLPSLHLDKYAKTIDEAKAVIKTLLARQKLTGALIEFFNAVSEEVKTKKAQLLDIHPERLKKEAEHKKSELRNLLKQQGLKYNEYLEILGRSEDEINAMIADEVKQEYATRFASFAVARSVYSPEDDKKFELSEEEFNAAVKLRALEVNLPGYEFLKLVTQNQDIKNQFSAQAADEKMFVAVVGKYYPEKVKEYNDLKAKAETEINKLVSLDAPAEEAKEEKSKEAKSAKTK
ncbi:trigger factor [Mycoplasmopsis columbinasalis]|uniref:Trigger factor n=1 Tax=Mycoplasmopsis columbinasalis TaxID=114880 RepID=A0A449BA44_9BACT|nr:trigger factor [Mycoplasmopsis columbinasalis]VEU78018.1 Trigger factor [Mycoplasmopsis columbinasalis]